MPQYNFRVNIQSSTFPLLSEDMGDDVILDHGDQTYVPNYNPSTDGAPVERGVAQVMYAHNVMPSTYGYQSVGYTSKYPAAGIAGIKFDYILPVISTTGTLVYVGVDDSANHALYVLNGAGVWIVPGGQPNVAAGNKVTVATINGRSYVCISNTGVWQYNSVSSSFEWVTLTGLAVAGINGLVSSNGYLIAWSDTGIAWSAVDDPTDFTPSDITGAGAGSIQDARGKLTYCQPTSYGFIAYAENNAISVTWSGNTNYPFNFKSLPGAGGVASGRTVTAETVNAQYAYTTNGMQQVYHTGAKTVLAYLTDFVAGGIFEDYDEAGQVLNITTFIGTLAKKLTLINDRYLVLSYGLAGDGPFTHAIVVDLVQARMGKLKIEHADVFELKDLSPVVTEVPRDSIAFLLESGEVKLCNFNQKSNVSSGVLICGRYRLQRGLKTRLQKVLVENVEQSASFSCSDFGLLESKVLDNPTLMMVDPATVSSNTRLRAFYNEIEADSHTLIFQGRFSINTIVLTVIPGGDY